MLPSFTTSSSSLSSISSNSNTNFVKPENLNFSIFLKRILEPKQMDFEAASDQLLSLLSLDSSRAYTHFFYRKQTKNQWARDDPAFVVLQIYFILICTLSYIIAIDKPNFWGYVWSCIYNIMINWLFIAIFMASTTSYIANKFLIVHHSHSVEQKVEWLFAFDIHLNASFCSFMITYVLQYFLLPILISRNILSCFISIILHGIGGILYSYHTYLGYKTLPYLGNPQIFLWYPILFIIIICILSFILLGSGFMINYTRIFINLYNI